MRETTPALSELRDATRDLHDQLEASLPVAAPGAGRDDFVHYLQDMWGWLSCFETRLWNAEWPADMHAQARNGKLKWIETDLRTAGMTSRALMELPLADYNPALDTSAKRIGVAYVIEGAQLGTRVLSRALAPSLGDWSSRWLAGYGEQHGSHWRGFIMSAESVLDTQDARREAAAAASQAFASLAQWFAQRQQVRAECEVRRVCDVPQV